jgi:hypothetical protein
MCDLGADEQTNHFNGFNKSFAIVPSGDKSSSSDLKIRCSQLPSILLPNEDRGLGSGISKHVAETSLPQKIPGLH